MKSRLYPGADIFIAEEWVCNDDAQTGQNSDRPGYQRILAGIRSRAFDVLLVSTVQRVTRDLTERLTLLDRLHCCRVECISASDGSSSHDPNARLIWTAAGMGDESSNAQHVFNTLRSMEQRFRDGFSTGNVPHYGYRATPTRETLVKNNVIKSHYLIEVVPEEAEIIIQVFKWVLSGYGRRKITRILNGMPISSPGPSHIVRGPIGEWTENHVRGILDNERYAGVWVYRKTSLHRDPDCRNRKKKRSVPNDASAQVHMDPEHAERLRIIPLDLWNQYQAMIERRGEVRRLARNRGERIFGDRVGKSGPEHLITGTFRCVVCGNRFFQVSGKGGGFYGCYGAHRKHECGVARLIHGARLETALVGSLRSVLRRRDWIDDLAARVNRALEQHRIAAPTSEENLRKKIATLETELSNLVRFIAAGNASEAVARAVRDNERVKAGLEVDLHHTVTVRASNLRILPATIGGQIERIVRTLADDALQGAQALRALFPEGIGIEAPRSERDDNWRVDLVLDPSRVVMFREAKIAVGADLPVEEEPIPPRSGGGTGGDLSGSGQSGGVLSATTNPSVATPGLSLVRQMGQDGRQFLLWPHPVWRYTVFPTRFLT